jgi:hypothetical protein
MRASHVIAGAVGVVAMLASPPAGASCRTTTCPLPPDFAPSSEGCYPQGFGQYCASLSPPAKPLPIWWRNACVSYDLQRVASRQIAYDTAAAIISKSFAKWTASTCAGQGSSSRVSIDVRDLGPVDCGQVQYNSDQGNQHVIVFHDDKWPHNDANNTLALTTVTFDPDTGEVYDADMEINATVPLTVGDPVPPDGYDFESIVTHETGHFLGMAHSGDGRATMFAHYTPGSTAMRALTMDDVSGLCAIYPTDGSRVVDPAVVPGGKAAEDACDPTPRHGFSTQCASSSGGNIVTKNCAVAGAAPGMGSGAPFERAAPWLLGLCLAAVVARRRSGPRM